MILGLTVSWFMSAINFSDEIVVPVLNALPIGILLVDAMGEIILSNDKCEDILGFSAGELKGSPIDCLVPKRFSPDRQVLMADFMSEPTARAMAHGRILPALKKADSLMYQAKRSGKGRLVVRQFL